MKAPVKLEHFQTVLEVWKEKVRDLQLQNVVASKFDTGNPTVENRIRYLEIDNEIMLHLIAMNRLISDIKAMQDTSL